MAKTFGEENQTEEKVWPPTGGSKMTMDTLDPVSQNYMDLGIGKGGVEFTVKGLSKVPEKKYFFKNKEGEAIEDPELGSFKYLLVDEDGQKLSINTWMLWNLLRQAFKSCGAIEGTQLRIDHPERGQYLVHYLEVESKEWIKVELPKREE